MRDLMIVVTDLMIPGPTEKKSLREVLEAADIKQVFPPGEVVAYSNYSSGSRCLHCRGSKWSRLPGICTGEYF